MGQRLELRLMSEKDLEAVLTLDRLCFGQLWSEDGYRRELESPNSTLLVLELTATQELVGIGCFWAILEEAHITILGIHPEYRHRGWGYLLLHALLVAAAKAGLERATLEVRESNTVAIALYQKFGFKVAGRRRKYYSDPEEDAFILWRSQLAQFSAPG